MNTCRAPTLGCRMHSAFRGGVFGLRCRQIGFHQSVAEKCVKVFASPSILSASSFFWSCIHCWLLGTSHVPSLDNAMARNRFAGFLDREALVLYACGQTYPLPR